MMIRTALILLSLLACLKSLGAQSSFHEFLSCLVHNEYKLLGGNVAVSRIAAEQVSSQQLPSISSTLNATKDLTRESSPVDASLWQIGVEQVLYNKSLQKSVEGFELQIKSEIESMRSQLILQSQAQWNLVFQFLSLRNQLATLQNRIELQKGILGVLRQLTESGVVDGSHMLLAETDLKRLEVQLAELKIVLERNIKEMETIPFVTTSLGHETSKIQSFFSSISQSDPLLAEKRPVVNQLDWSLKSNQSFLESDESSWIPQLSASVEFGQALDSRQLLNGTRNNFAGGIRLSFPVSESFTFNQRKSARRGELKRIESVKKRQVTLIEAAIDAERKSLKEARDSQNLLNAALETLETSRKILLKKIQINRATYFDIVDIYERIRTIQNQIFEKQLTAWRIQTNWETERLVVEKNPQSLDCRIRREFKF